MVFSTFDELEDYLRRFTGWEDGEGFDFGAAIHLFAACADALRKNALEAELEDIHEYLDDDQRAFILQLGRILGGDKRSTEGGE